MYYKKFKQLNLNSSLTKLKIKILNNEEKSVINKHKIKIKNEFRNFTNNDIIKKKFILAEKKMIKINGLKNRCNSLLKNICNEKNSHNSLDNFKKYKNTKNKIQTLSKDSKKLILNKSNRVNKFKILNQILDNQEILIKDTIKRNKKKIDTKKRNKLMKNFKKTFFFDFKYKIKFRKNNLKLKLLDGKIPDLNLKVKNININKIISLNKLYNCYKYYRKWKAYILTKKSKYYYYFLQNKEKRIEKFKNYIFNSNYNKVINILNIDPFITYQCYNYKNQNSLCIAIFNNDYKMVKILLKNYCQIDCFDNLKKTPLFYSIYKRNYKITEKIIKYKCNIWNFNLNEIKIHKEYLYKSILWKRVEDILFNFILINIIN